MGHIPGVDPSFLTLNAFTSPLPECQAKDRKSSAEKPITSSPIPAVHFSKKKATSFTSIKELSVECEGNKKQELFRWKTIPEIILPDTDDSQLQNRVDKVVRADSKVIELPDRMLDLPIPSALRVLVSHSLVWLAAIFAYRHVLHSIWQASEVSVTLSGLNNGNWRYMLYI